MTSLVLEQAKPTPGFVAYVDILGFRSMVLREPDLGSFMSRYVKLLNGSLGNARDRHGVRNQLFSDSLFLWSEEALPGQLRSLLACCAELLSDSVRAGLPLRGAVSHGQVMIQEQPAIAVGRAILEAVEWEQMQEWVGIILAPSAIAFALSNTGVRSGIQPLVAEWVVPTKGDPHGLKTWAVKPAHTGLGELDDLSRRLREIGLQSGNASAQRKCESTVAFLSELASRLRNPAAS